jgi:hypothetical protein
MATRARPTPMVAALEAGAHAQPQGSGTVQGESAGPRARGLGAPRHLGAGLPCAGAHLPGARASHARGAQLPGVPLFTGE